MTRERATAVPVLTEEKRILIYVAGRQRRLAVFLALICETVDYDRRYEGFLGLQFVISGRVKFELCVCVQKRERERERERGSLTLC